MIGLEVKMYANLSWRAMISDQKKTPITKEVTTETLVANLAAFPFPAPSSFDTRTLRYYNKFLKHPYSQFSTIILKFEISLHKITWNSFHKMNFNTHTKLDKIILKYVKKPYLEKYKILVKLKTYSHTHPAEFWCQISQRKTYLEAMYTCASDYFGISHFFYTRVLITLLNPSALFIPHTIFIYFLCQIAKHGTFHPTTLLIRMWIFFMSNN